MRSIEVEGSSIDDAIARALSALRVERDRVAIEILSNSTRGVFGLGSRRARIRATVREPQGRLDEGDGVSRETPTVSDERGFPGNVRRRTPDRFDVEPGRTSRPNQGPRDGCPSCPAGTHGRSVRRRTCRDLRGRCGGRRGPRRRDGLVIGRQGQTLDAIEYLLNRIVGRDRDQGTPPRVVIDVEGYRERRQESLEQLAPTVGSERAQDRPRGGAQPDESAGPADRAPRSGGRPIRHHPERGRWPLSSGSDRSPAVTPGQAGISSGAAARAGSSARRCRHPADRPISGPPHALAGSHSA